MIVQIIPSCLSTSRQRTIQGIEMSFVCQFMPEHGFPTKLITLISATPHGSKSCVRVAAEDAILQVSRKEHPRSLGVRCPFSCQTNSKHHHHHRIRHLARCPTPPRKSSSTCPSATKRPGFRSESAAMGRS